MRANSEYLAPVDSDNLIVCDRRRGSCVTEFMKELVRKRERRDDIEETEAEARERVARAVTERPKNDRLNELLTADRDSSGVLGKIADRQSGEQKEGESRDSRDGSTE